MTGVFDVHVHVQPWRRMKPAVLATLDKKHEQNAELLDDPRKLIAYMDECGVERICCINYVSPDVMGFTEDAIDWILDFTKDHRDRLLPVGSVHPLRSRDVKGDANRLLDRGIRMMKVHPPHQRFSPNDYRRELPQLAGLYEACQERSVPVMIHTGTSIFPGARNVYADPMPVDDVAIDFPELKIILAHFGRPLYAETAFFLVRRHPNVMTDLSGIPPKSLDRFVPRLREIAGKTLWGTDWPSPGIISLRRNIDEFLALGFGEEIERKILRENAERLFGFRISEAGV